ncbi:hypothetical protein BGZ92_009844 [Podila epicladia]|nr:hypothetical protein BGZ92_009844 [Podila epicladia]
MRSIGALWKSYPYLEQELLVVVYPQCLSKLPLSGLTSGAVLHLQSALTAMPHEKTYHSRFSSARRRETHLDTDFAYELQTNVIDLTKDRKTSSYPAFRLI